MNRNIKTLLNIGSEGLIVEIECQLSNGLPSMIIVGLGNKAIDEAKERIRNAFAATRLPWPKKRITINLAPADVPKESTSLDVAITAAILQAENQLKHPVEHAAFIGEVGLDGSVRPVRGVIGKILAGQKAGISRFYVPKGNERQALLVPSVELVAIESITELCTPAVHIPTGKSGLAVGASRSSMSLQTVAGQEHAKRALEIAAAGNHNILLFGPPGTGKSMLAKCLPTLLPPPTRSEMLEITHLHSLANNNYDDLITTRPFRSPHNSASYISVIGGGSSIQPGEITLSHRGVLFLDELPEFGRSIIEALRQPLEDKYITIARARYSVRFPADFLLVATANPCPCGYYGSDLPCHCTPSQIMRYRQKISGPILDRIDLHVPVNAIDHSKILTNSHDGAAAHALQRKRIDAARALQRQRYDPREKDKSFQYNEDVSTITRLRPDAVAFLNTAASRLRISARSYVKLIAVSRTIADLEGSLDVNISHVSEALQYRPQSPTI